MVNSIDYERNFGREWFARTKGRAGPSMFAFYLTDANETLQTIDVNGCYGTSHLFHAHQVCILCSIVLINPRATPSGLLTQYLLYMVYTPDRYGITTTYLMFSSYIMCPPSIDFTFNRFTFLKCMIIYYAA